MTHDQKLSDFVLPTAPALEHLAAVPRQAQRRREHFIIVPGYWAEQLKKAQYIATYRVALHMLYRNWKGKGEPFTLYNRAIEGVKRGAKWRALLELEQLGLITIERRKRKSPRVSVLLKKRQEKKDIEETRHRMHAGGA